MKIVIAGGTGFIGGHLAEELNRRGHKVLLLDVVEGCLDDLNFTPDFIKGDVTQLNDFGTIVKDRGYSTLVYLAGISHTCSAGKMISENYRNGLYGLSKLLDQGGKHLSKVLIASSSLISGLLKDTEGTVKANETWVDTGESYHPYVSNKIAMEMCVRDWAHLNNKNFIIARFGTTYGERMRPGVVDDIFIRRAMNNKPLLIHGDGKQWRQHIYVGELVRGIRMALEKGDAANNKVFYLVPDYKVNVKEMAWTVKYLIPGTKVEYVDKRALDIKVKYINPFETNKLLEWKNELLFSQGMSLTVDWYKEHPNWMPKESTEDYFSKAFGYETGGKK